MTRRSIPREELLGGHQKCWLWGRHVLTECLRRGRWLPHELHVGESTLGEFTPLAESLGVPVLVETVPRLTQLCGTADHQGVIARMPPFPYQTMEDVLQKGSGSPLFVLTDHLQDAHNFGAIIRSGAGLGATGLFVPDREQVGVTSQVARSSAGTVNHLPIARVPDLTALIDRLHARGVRTVAATERGTTSPWEADLTGPVALLIGNEARGIAPERLDRCDLTVAIPLTQGVESLNAAVAAGILLYEAARQRG